MLAIGRALMSYPRIFLLDEPSLVAEVIAREIRGQLLGKPVKKKKLQLLPPRRSPTPPPERVTKVPTAFRTLVGDHAEHPGTGQGNRARQRVVA